MSTPHAPTIVIVGGVAGGASAAARARRVNEHARIVLFEKDEHVSFANCGLPYYIGGEIRDRDKLLVASPQMLRDRFNLEIHTRHQVTGIDRQNKAVTVLNRDTGQTHTQRYDKLILAPGASPIVPPMPGIDADNVFTLRNLRDTDKIKGYLHDENAKRAVVIGAGFIGLEMVEMFRHLDMRVDLIEKLNQVLPPLDEEMARLVEAELRSQGVNLHLGNGFTGFQTQDGKAVAVHLEDGSKLEADLFLVGIGVRPATELAQEAGLQIGDSRGIRVDEYCRTSDPDIYAVGDAAEYRHAVADIMMRIPLGGPANRAGRIAGQHAATGESPQMPSVLGTAIVRVFGVTAAVTGCNLRCAKQMGCDEPKAVWVTAKHHAGYYPGAEAMTIKLLYEPSSEKILGAQIVGGAGVDKRIDVLATATQLGASVRQLTELDLAYAPPFGSAKDPVHMAGFAATNERDGLVDFAEPWHDLEGVQVVDVRTADEIQKLPLPGAAPIPIDELRQRVGELDPTKPTAVVCHSGLRAYAGARLLMQHGFEKVCDLGGGMRLRQHTTAYHSEAPERGTEAGQA
jgi:NADPH-dependent 2,4-dienoyl-CoA reductase/sulfur reductase-like enzyme/rhodanese-related sulfurtransferase